MKFKKYAALTTALLILAFSACSCGKDEAPEGENDITQPGADDIISMPEGENKEEEIIINNNYADSEPYYFTGTVDEIYDDGSILVYSPDFRVNFNYKVIVEFDENTVVDNFELRENQHIDFEVYSAVKKSEPLTVVASKLTLLNEVSTQREEEAKRIAELEERAKNIMLGNTDVSSDKAEKADE